MIHNFYLTVISGSLLALFIEQLLPTVWRNGVYYAICDHEGGWTDELVILYYVSLEYRTPFCLDDSAHKAAAKLSYQIRGAHRHHLPRPEEETLKYAPILQHAQAQSTLL